MMIKRLAEDVNDGGERRYVLILPSPFVTYYALSLLRQAKKKKILNHSIVG